MSVLQKDNNGNITNYTGVPSANEGLPLGFIFISALPQLNVNYHLLNGDSVLITDYSEFYALLTALVSQSWNLTCTANEYAEDIAKTGNCGKFVINTTSSDATGTYTDANDSTTTITVSANSFKLPTITRFIQGISSLTDLGNSVEAGLPNITGNIYKNDSEPISFKPATNITSSGALGATKETKGVNGGTLVSGYQGLTGITFDASLSNSIYGNSATVQPQTTQYPYYIVLKNNSNSGLMNYLNNLAEAGVQSLGGAVGNITLSSKLKILNNELDLNQNSWVDGQNTSITNTQTTTETSIDMSSFISDYDADGEYEILINPVINSSSEVELYFGSDIITTFRQTVTSGPSQNYNVFTCIVPLKKYLKYRFTRTGFAGFGIYLIGYRRIK